MKFSHIVHMLSDNIIISC